MMHVCDFELRMAIIGLILMCCAYDSSCEFK